MHRIKHGRAYARKENEKIDFKTRLKNNRDVFESASWEKLKIRDSR